MRARGAALTAIPIGIGLVLWGALRAPAADAPAAETPAADAPATETSAETTSATASPTPVESAAESTTSISSPAPSATPASSASPSEGAHATAMAPSGTRIALDAPIVVTFDRAVEHEGVRLSIEPAAPGETVWRDARTLAFVPARWAEGKPYRVRVEGPAVAPAAFEFRTLVPAPERIESGHGARMVLTFDDGADRPAQVSALLDLLEAEQVQAIFFPTGKWAGANPRMIERMSRDGHRVCNHTYSHLNLRLPQLTEDEIRSEIARGAGAGTCELFRPPLKALDPRVERIIAAMGYKLYLWDIDSRDWEGAAAEDIVNLVLSKAHPGAVVLFHMHAAATLAALPVLLRRLRKSGYVFRDPEDAGAPPAGGAAPAPQ